MLSRLSFHKRLTTALVLVLAGLGNSILAGDKIEFSSPSTQMTAPDLQKEEGRSRQSAASGFNFGSSPSPLGFTAPPVVNAPPSSSRNQRAKDKNSMFGDSKDGDGSLDNLLNEPTREKPSGKKWATATADSHNSASPSREDDFDRDRAGRASRSDTTPLNFNAPGSRFSDNDRSSVASWRNDQRSGSDSYRDEQFKRMEEVKALYDLPNSTTPVGSPNNSLNPLHDYTWPTGSRQPPSREDFLPRKPSDLAAPSFGPRSVAGPEFNNRSLFGSGFGTPNNQSLGNGQTRTQPAALAFPKRPGELLK
jgi:hypothetical protein